jgi:hypothetical protein
MVRVRVGVRVGVRVTTKGAGPSVFGWNLQCPLQDERTPDRNAIGHTRMHELQANQKGVKLNEKCKFLPKTRTVPALTASVLIGLMAVDGSCTAAGLFTLLAVAPVPNCLALLVPQV